MLIGSRAGAGQSRALSKAAQPTAHAEGRHLAQAGRNLVLMRTWNVATAALALPRAAASSSLLQYYGGDFLGLAVLHLSCLAVSTYYWSTQ